MMMHKLQIINHKTNQPIGYITILQMLLTRESPVMQCSLHILDPHTNKTEIYSGKVLSLSSDRIVVDVKGL